MTNTALKVYDDYEISPCRRYENPGRPGTFYFEVSEPDEADVWTLYGHVTGEGVEAIGDFASREAAETTYFRITGVKFGGSYTAKVRLRVMHAGEKLLAALQALAATARTFRNVPKDDQQWTTIDDDALEGAFAAIAEATGCTSKSPVPRPQENRESRRRCTGCLPAAKRRDWAAIVRRIRDHSLTDNDRRAMRVEHVLTWCLDWDTARKGMIDLLTDARHWCDRHDESFAELNHIAYGHYIAELNEQQAQE